MSDDSGDFPGDIDQLVWGVGVTCSKRRSACSCVLRSPRTEFGIFLDCAEFIAAINQWVAIESCRGTWRRTRTEPSRFCVPRSLPEWTSDQPYFNARWRSGSQPHGLRITNSRNGIGIINSWYGYGVSDSRYGNGAGLTSGNGLSTTDGSAVFEYESDAGGITQWNHPLIASGWTFPSLRMVGHRNNLQHVAARQRVQRAV